MNEAFKELYVDGALKPKHQHLETKGLTHISHLRRDFQVKWIRPILSCVHNGKLWLDKPIYIIKKMIHRITRLPLLNKEKMTKTLGQVELTKRTLFVWDERGMKLNVVTNMELKFCIHVIAHKIYNSSRLNGVSCEAIDLAYKVVKNNLSFDLVELLLNQFNKNMESIRVSKNNPYKFGSLLTFLYFFVQKFSLPKVLQYGGRKDVPILYQINEYIAEMGENFDNIMDNY